MKDIAMGNEELMLKQVGKWAFHLTLHFFRFIFTLCVLVFIHMYVCVPSACSAHGGKREHRISWNCNGWRFGVTMLVLGTKLKFSPRAASSLLFIAGLSPHPWTLLLINRVAKNDLTNVKQRELHKSAPHWKFVNFLNGDQIASGSMNMASTAAVGCDVPEEWWGRQQRFSNSVMHQAQINGPHAAGNN